MCSSGASYIIYDNEDLTKILIEYFNYTDVKDEDKYDDQIQQFNQVDYTIFQL